MRYQPKEIEDMVAFLPKDPTEKYFYYEDYVHMLTQATNKHVDGLYKVNLLSKEK